MDNADADKLTANDSAEIRPQLEKSDAPSNSSASSLLERLPARMLNEFVYCPRLFYYEYVEGVFVHNADTLRGAAVHTRVDAGSGAMPAPDGNETPETIHSRPH